MLKNKIILLISFAVVFAILGCNEADDGFNAPNGATVTFVTPPYTRAGFGSSVVGDAIDVVTVRVDVPIGGGVSGAGAETEAANQVSGFIQCPACNLYVFKEGVTTYLPERSLIDLVASGTVTFKTNQQGLYTFVVGALPPLARGCIDDDGNPEECTTSVKASIGVFETSLAVTSAP
jgi:hypothetical protein